MISCHYSKTLGKQAIIISCQDIFWELLSDLTHKSCFVFGSVKRKMKLADRNNKFPYISSIASKCCLNVLWRLDG